MKATLAVIGFGLAALGVGCGGGDGMSRHDVTVALAPELANSSTPPSVRVDIVAVNPTEVGRWESMSMTEYWSRPDSLRSGAEKFEMAFAPGNTSPKTLKASDPIWTKWGAPDPYKKVGMQLFILADLPGMHQDLPGSNDNRRVILPLDMSRWEGQEPIRVTVQQGRVVSETTPKPPPKK